MSTTDSDRVPFWVHMAEIPLTDDEHEGHGWPDGTPAHVTPVGGWCLALLALLVLGAFVTWKLVNR